MKLLLTSGGITNDTLARELEDLVGKTFAELNIAFIITAAMSEQGNKDWLILDLYRLHERGAKVDVIDITQLPAGKLSQRLEWADVIFVGGGNEFYLSYCMQKAGLFETLPALLKNKVYAGISAGSMVATQTILTASQAHSSEHFYDESYEEFEPADRSSAHAMRWVNFAFWPHLNSHYFPNVTQAKMQGLADRQNVPIYVADDACAVKVNGEEITVVGEGEWHKLEPTI